MFKHNLNLQSDVTSYDYDAPMTEAGDVTPKYQILRNVIKDYLPLPNIPVPAVSTKMQLPTVELHAKTTLLSAASRQHLGSSPIQSKKPKTFEELKQFSGFVLYETELPKDKRDPSVLTIPDLRDRAIVTVDNVSLSLLYQSNLKRNMHVRLRIHIHFSSL